MEAAIVLPLVIITLLFIANILNICMVHLCMQQSLNNTAKKISQDSYLIYRIAGENNYSEFINKLGNIDDDYKEFEGKATDVKNSFNGLQKSIGESINSTDVLLNETFKDFDITNIKVFCTKLDTNFNNFLTNWKTTMNNISKTVNSIKELCINGKKNIKSVVIKLLTDGITGVATTSIVKSVFDTYRKELKAPSATNIDEKSIIPFHTTLNPEDGTFTIAMNYIYKNPFGFVNSKSTEYSIINKTIRMTNVITIRPFVGKNGSSLVGSVKEIDVGNVDMEEVEIATNSEIKDKIASESQIDSFASHKEKILSKRVLSFHYHDYYTIASCSYMQAEEDKYDYIKTYNLANIFPAHSCESCVLDESKLTDDSIVYYLKQEIYENGNNWMKLDIKYHTNKDCSELLNVIEKYKYNLYPINVRSDKYISFNEINDSDILQHLDGGWNLSKDLYDEFFVDKSTIMDDGCEFIKLYIPCGSCWGMKVDDYGYIYTKKVDNIAHVDKKTLDFSNEEYKRWEYGDLIMSK